MTDPSKRLVALGLGLVLLVACTARSGTESRAVSTTSIPESTAPSVAEPVPTTAGQPTADGEHIRDIEIPTNDGPLVGDLFIPEGAGPHPGIVLIHGSGPISRRAELTGQLNLSFGFSIPVFTELAEGLQDAGYAVLTFDKRTCGPFNGCADNGYPQPGDDLTIGTFISDAQAAVETLADHPDVDGERLAVVGHSQGATFVPVMLNADARLQAGVMLAGPHDPPDVLLQTQSAFTHRLLDELDMTAEQEQEATSAIDQAVEDLAAIRSGSLLPADPILGATPGLWQSWMDHADDVPQVAADLERPLLIVIGEQDWNVPPAQANAWRQTLASSTASHEVEVFPCITHALNCVTETQPADIQPNDIGRHVSQDLIDRVVAFLDSTRTDSPED